MGINFKAQGNPVSFVFLFSIDLIIGKRFNLLKIEKTYITNVKEYIELHIEQGRVLEDSKKEVGIVNTIAGGIKVLVEIKGMSEHAGSTPMTLRLDSLAAVAEMILEVEKIGRSETDTSVATVGFIDSFPNSMNVVPGLTKFSVDLRDNYTSSMDSMLEKKHLILLK